MEQIEENNSNFTELVLKFGTPVKPTKKPPRPEKKFQIINERVVWLDGFKRDSNKSENDNPDSSIPSLKCRSDTDSDGEPEVISKLDNITKECLNFINSILKSLSYLMEFKSALYVEFQDNKEVSVYLMSVFREIEPLQMLYNLVLEKITDLQNKGSFCLPDLFLDKEVKGPLNIYKSFFSQYAINTKWVGEFMKTSVPCQEVCRQVKDKLQLDDFVSVESCLYTVFGSLFSFELFINRYCTCFDENHESRQKAEEVKCLITSLLSIINSNLDQENFLITHKELNLMTGRSRETKITTKFIYKGITSKLSRRDYRMLPRQLILFSDCLYVTLLPGNISGTSSVRQELSLDTMNITKISVEDEKISSKWGLNISAREAYQDFYFDDEATMNLWITKLQSVIANKSIVSNDFPKVFTKPKIGEEPPRWQKDSSAGFCNGYKCNQRFSSTVRRHHCRTDGLLYCDPCCSYKATVKFEKNVESRVCELCFSILQRDKINPRKVEEAEKLLELVFDKKNRKGMKFDWLEEKSYNCDKGTFNSPTKYFCELHEKDPFLTLYEKPEDKMKHHGIMLLGMGVRIKKESRFIKKLKSVQFIIEHLDKNEAYIFDASSKENCDEWVKCLRENINSYCNI